ncbi:MAG: aminoacyl-tRNA hydrolase [bacterium]
MLLIVGLGNPGNQYAGNRHNIGFQAVDVMADYHSFDKERQKFSSLIREGIISHKSSREKALIIKPQTYYNESGRAVKEAAQFYKIPADKIIVLHDELDLAPGKVKVKQGGSAAGNNGLKSIISQIDNDFYRIRIGIGHPGDKSKVTNYVLNDFSKSEQQSWVDIMVQAIAAEIPHFTQPDGTARFLSALALRTAPPNSHKGQPQSQKKKKQVSDDHPSASSATTTSNSTVTSTKKDTPFSGLHELFTKKD